MEKEIKRTRADYLKKNTLIFALGNFGVKGVSFFLVPLYTYVLSSAEYGIIDIVVSITTVVTPVLTLNISEAVLRFSQDKDAKHQRIMSVGLVSLLIAFLGTCVTIPLISMVKMLSPYAYLICGYMLSLAGYQMFMSFLRGKEYLVQYSVGNIFHAFMVAICNIVLVAVFHQGIRGYLLSYIVSNSIVAMYAFGIGKVWTLIRRFDWDFALFREMAHYSLLLIPTSLLWWIVSSSDRVMISAFINETAVGLYAVSCKLPTLITTLASVFNVAWSYSAIKESDSEDREEYSNRIYKRFFAVILVVSAGLLMIIKPFMKIYVSEEFYSAWRYMPSLVIGSVCLTLGSFLATAYTVNKNSWGFLKSAGIGALTNILLNLMCIPTIGIQGAALATCASHIAVFVFRAADTRKYIKITLLSRKHVLAYLCLLTMALTVYIDGAIGQIMLVGEWICVVLLFYKYWVQMLSGIKKER